MVLNAVGRMVESVWNELPGRFDRLALDGFVVMPNHLHAIIIFNDHSALTAANVGAPLVGALVANVMDTHTRAGTRPAPTGAIRKPTLGDIVGAFKSITTDHYIAGVEYNDWLPFVGKLWQRNYYEHVIRNDGSLERIRSYILANPACWAYDRENPESLIPEKEDAWGV